MRSQPGRQADSWEHFNFNIDNFLQNAPVLWKEAKKSFKETAHKMPPPPKYENTWFIMFGEATVGLQSFLY